MPNYKTPKELDPSGKDAHDPGAKLDSGKNMIATILAQFRDAIPAVTEVGTFGANKYSLGGWKSVPEGKRRYSDAMLRHWFKLAQGEKIDPDSGLHHAAHMAWNALAILQFEIDDDQDWSIPS